MTTSNSTQRKNFRCIFNYYVTNENKDAVVRSVISQFEGYFAEPEVTLTNDGFILTITLGENLSASMARDKILWNQFIESVTAQDMIRKIQIIRLPKASILNPEGREPGVGSVGGFGPEVDPETGDTGVNEKLNVPRTNKPPKYVIDADSGDSLGRHAGIHYADPSDELSEGQSFVPGLTPQDLDSNANSVTDDNDPHSDLESGKIHKSIPKVFNAGFKRIAIDTDTGAGNFTMTKPNGLQDVGTPPDSAGRSMRQPSDAAPSATGVGGGADISGASWYVYDPLNAQGTELGSERDKGYDNASSAPFGNITTGSKDEKEPEEQDVRSAVELSQAQGGGQSVPDGGQVEGWYAMRYAHDAEHPHLKNDVENHIYSHHKEIVHRLWRGYVDGTDYNDPTPLMNFEEYGNKLLEGRVHPNKKSALDAYAWAHTMHTISHKDEYGGDHPHRHEDLSVKIPNDISNLTAAVHEFGLNEYYDYEGDIDDY